MSYKTLNKKETEEFLNTRGSKEAYKKKGHSFTPLKGTGKSYCKSCGLVALNNPLTDWCIQMGCNYRDHTQYNNKVKRLTEMF